MRARRARGAASRQVLLLLALLFLGPLGLASWLYFASGWRPPGHTNHGSLIDPPRPLASRAFLGKWSLVYVGACDCDADCKKTLFFMRQTHLGLGNLYGRVQRVFVPTTRCDELGWQRQYPNLISLSTSDATAALLGAFPAGQRPTGIFVVDPRGELMMRYDSNASPQGLLTDLKTLLGLSSIG